MASAVKFVNSNLTKRLVLRRCQYLCLRSLSTAHVNNKDSTEGKIKLQQVPDFSKPLENKNWVSYGFDYHDEKVDKLRAHVQFFLAVTLCVILGGFFVLYLPDYKHRDWARREAFIRLHEREQLGLEPIDPNYVDPSKMILPSDEELGDMEIII